MTQRLDQIEASILELATTVRELKRGGNNFALDALTLRVTALEGTVVGNVENVASADAMSVDANGNPVEAAPATKFFDTFLAALNEEVPVVNAEVEVLASVEPVAEVTATVIETPVADVATETATATTTETATETTSVASAEVAQIAEPVAVVEPTVETTEVAVEPTIVEPVVESVTATVVEPVVNAEVATAEPAAENPTATVIAY